MIKERKPNYQALLNMVALAEKHKVNMANWVSLDKSDDDIDPRDEPVNVSLSEPCSFHDGYSTKEIGDDLIHHMDECGTVGCLVGTYTLAYPQSVKGKTAEDVIRCWDNTGRSAPPELIEHLGITDREFKWLFLWERVTTAICENNHPSIVRTIIKTHKRNLADINTNDAVKRLRRFIYFKLKQEELHEAWNARIHTKHAQAQNTNYVINMVSDKSNA